MRITNAKMVYYYDGWYRFCADINFDGNFRELPSIIDAGVKSIQRSEEFKDVME
jgi:hypothetical protein